jgi:hypothetical protein
MTKEQKGIIILVVCYIIIFAVLFHFLNQVMIAERKIAYGDDDNVTVAIPNGTMLTLTWDEYCDWIFFGDAGEEGYVFEKVENCKK